LDGCSVLLEAWKFPLEQAHTSLWAAHVQRCAVLHSVLTIIVQADRTLLYFHNKACNCDLAAHSRSRRCDGPMLYDRNSSLYVHSLSLLACACMRMPLVRVLMMLPTRIFVWRVFAHISCSEIYRSRDAVNCAGRSVPQYCNQIQSISIRCTAAINSLPSTRLCHTSHTKREFLFEQKEG